MDRSYDYQTLFGSLNENQTKALTSTNNSLLQIIAGPGTGKTKLLVARVAYLLLHFHLPPSAIIVTTFTKKAAKEMNDRLEMLLQNNTEIDPRKLHIGTFHSICFGYLRHYGKIVGLKKDFKIADDKDKKDFVNKAIINCCLDDIKNDKDAIKKIISYISHQKSLGLHPDDIPLIHPEKTLEIQQVQVYAEYQKLLYENSFIDFDDILVFTSKLLDKRPELASHIQHILIDEFQDTNTIQLQLIFKFSKYCNDNITIVGDADQSIYGFRNATYENFNTMEEIARSHKTQVIKVALEQNYRSSNNILEFSEQIMSSQNGRVGKTLISNIKCTDPVYYVNFKDFRDEPVFVSNRIKKVIAEQCENDIAYRDIAIIARASRTFPAIERELIRKGIPYKIVKGLSFWEIKEISMTVDCLRIIAFNDWLSYKRVIDWFSAGCGPKLIESIETSIFSPDQKNNDEYRAFDILQDYAAGKIKGATQKAKCSLAELISIIKEAREKLCIATLDDFYRFVLLKFNIIENSIKYKKSNKTDEEIRCDINENLEELKSQFVNYDPNEDDLLKAAQEEAFQFQDQRLSIAKEELESTDVDIIEDEKVGLLVDFLDHIYLAEGLSADDESDKNDTRGKVTLTTIHRAKGLEWCVVFLPSVVNSCLPSIFALNETDPEKKERALNEERRCLYVALTRAKEQLFICTYSCHNAYTTIQPSIFLENIPPSAYFDISSIESNPASQFIMPKRNTAIPQNFLHPDSKVDLSKPKKNPYIVTTSGINISPVTGAPINGIKKRRKRLGMGRPINLKSLMVKKE